MSKIESAENIFNKANSAFVDENFTEALELYNTAIEMDPSNAEYYVKRSACHYRLKQFTDAIADANTALKINPKHAQAYLRKGMAAFSLEEYESARASFQKGLELEPSNNIFKTWIRKCDAEMEEVVDDMKMEDNGQRERHSSASQSSLQPQAQSQPQPPLPSQTEPSSQSQVTLSSQLPAQNPISLDVNAKTTMSSSTSTPATTTTTTTSAVMQTSAPSTTGESSVTNVTSTSSVETQTPPTKERRTVADYKPEPKIRHEWFQTENTVNVSVFVKNVKKEAVTVQIEEQSLEVVIKLSDGGEYQLNLDLCDKIVPSKSSYQILSTKIEIILHKSKPCRWLSLEAIPGSEGTTAWGSVISTATTPTPPLVNKPVSTTTTPSSPATSAPQNTSATDRKSVV